MAKKAAKKDLQTETRVASGTNMMNLLERSQKQIALALPKHLDPDRMTRLAVTAIRRNPDLAKCDPVSVIGSMIQAAQLGLEIGIHAHLVPFWNSKRNCFESTFVPDYRGLMDIARRSGEVESIDALPVYEGDHFDFQYGIGAYLHHKPGPHIDDEKLTHAYAIAVYKSGRHQFRVINRRFIDGIRARSKSGAKGPWVTDFHAMACKTSVKQLCKFLPQSVELIVAVRADDYAEIGRSQGASDAGSAVLQEAFHDGFMVPGEDTGPDSLPSPAAPEQVRSQSTKDKIKDKRQQAQENPQSSEPVTTKHQEPEDPALGVTEEELDRVTGEVKAKPIIAPDQGPELTYLELCARLDKVDSMRDLNLLVVDSANQVPANETKDWKDLLNKKIAQLSQPRETA